MDCSKQRRTFVSGHGALVVAGGAGIAGNVVAGAVYEGTSRVVTMSRSIAMSIVFGG